MTALLTVKYSMSYGGGGGGKFRDATFPTFQEFLL